MGFLIHGRHARILARIFGVRSEDRGGGGGGGREIQFYNITGTEKYSFTLGNDHVFKISCMKDPISQNIPYIKSLTVFSYIRLIKTSYPARARG